VLIIGCLCFCSCHCWWATLRPPPSSLLDLAVPLSCLAISCPTAWSNQRWPSQQCPTMSRKRRCILGPCQSVSSKMSLSKSPFQLQQVNASFLASYSHPTSTMTQHLVQLTRRNLTGEKISDSDTRLVIKWFQSSLYFISNCSFYLM
jgi:hypothetical protein